MDNKLIIITAKNVDVKVVNRLLLSLRNWEYGDESIWDDSHILRSIDNVPPNGVMEHGRPPADIPPLQEFSPTEFHGKSFEEVEEMMLSKNKAGAGTSLFMVLDNKGLQDETIIVAERAIKISEADVNIKDLYLDGYNKVRVPWFESHSIWSNLIIGNMGFAEFCVEDQEIESDFFGWYTWKHMDSADHFTPYIKKRDTVLRELHKLDLA